MSKLQSRLFLQEAITVLAVEIANTLENDLMKFVMPVNVKGINGKFHPEKWHALWDWRRKVSHEFIGTMINLEEELKHNIETFGLTHTQKRETSSATEDVKTPLESLLTDVILERAKLLPSNIFTKISDIFYMQLLRFADIEQMKLKGNEQEFDTAFAIEHQKWKTSFIKKIHLFMIGMGMDFIKTLMSEFDEGIIAKLEEEVELSSEMPFFSIMLAQIRAEDIIESFSEIFETKFLGASGTEDSIIKMDSDTTSLGVLAHIAIYAQWKNNATEKIKHIMVNLAIDVLRAVTSDDPDHKKKSKFSSEVFSLSCTDLAELKQRASEKSTKIWLDFENELLQIYSQMNSPETDQPEIHIKAIRKQIAPWISAGIDKMKDIVNNIDRTIKDNFYKTQSKKKKKND
ncbi:hypothetical protein TNCV_1694851 [Trichonephila clavipes]|nr:hypothetical protein TNCV_1694851 [Trichonephila clavipes]